MENQFLLLNNRKIYFELNLFLFFVFLIIIFLSLHFLRNYSHSIYFKNYFLNDFIVGS